MKRSKADAAETRRRIVNTAAAAFRARGIAGAGLADVMAAAGLTHGGFYRHFDSKDQLVSEAIVAATDSVAEAMASVASRGQAGAGLKEVTSAYLSASHRDDLESGCPLAALGSEIARSDHAARQAATEGFLKLVDVLAAQSGRPHSQAARRKAMVALSAMVGALIMSRIVTDPDVSATLLEQTAIQLVKA
jgi:TetR/AcrR family transcriptional repressor of nem operon